MTIADETPDDETPDAPAAEVEQPEVPEVPEPAEVPEAEQPEPVIIGHGVVQDNVTSDDQVTSLPDGTETGRHTTEDAATPPALVSAPEVPEDDAEAPA